LGDLFHVADDILADTERPHLTAHYQTHEIADNLRALYGAMSEWENAIYKRPRLIPDQNNLGAGTSEELRTSDQFRPNCHDTLPLRERDSAIASLQLFSIF
jgi:hypothetical protein